MKNNIIKLSIIIPVYNAENYLKQCLDSIVTQIDSSVEVICVNDGSTDGSLSILEDYGSRYDQIKVIDQAGTGSPSAPRNRGVEVSRGEYIWYVDSDDCIKPNALVEILAKVAKYNDVECFIFGFETIDDKNNIINEYTSAYNTTDDVLTGTDAYLEYSIPSYPWNRVFRRDFVEKNNLCYRYLPEDEEFLIRGYTCLNSVVLFDYCCYSYRIIDSSSSVSRTPNNYIVYINGYFRVIKDHLTLYSQNRNNKFWSKCTFNHIKNINIKLAQYFKSGGGSYDSRQLFVDEKKLIKECLIKYKTKSKYYLILRMIYLSPRLFFYIINVIYRLKKR